MIPNESNVNMITVQDTLLDFFDDGIINGEGNGRWPSSFRSSLPLLSIVDRFVSNVIGTNSIDQIGSPFALSKIINESHVVRTFCSRTEWIYFTEKR